MAVIDSEREISDAAPLLQNARDEFGESTDTEAFGDKSFDHCQNVQYPLRKRYYVHWQVLITALVATCLSAAAMAVVCLRVGMRLQVPEVATKSHWKGFANIENYFAFGDSWTSTQFWILGEQPSFENPLGNPPFPGLTTSNGINYVGYLTTQYNQSFIKTYDLAYGGSVVDTAYDNTMRDELDLPHQLKNEFIKFYTRKENGERKPLGWQPSNTLFSTFFGINDIVMYDPSLNNKDLIFESYEHLIRHLYELSARNFLIINIPPVDKAPGIKDWKTTAEQAQYAARVNEFNRLIKAMIENLRATYSDITIFEYDVHDLYLRVAANPRSIPMTLGYRDTTDYCPVYEMFANNTSPTQEQLESCGGLNVNEYLWLNSLHPTEPFHEAMACEIETLLATAQVR